jgi:hypothetical protein
MEARITGAHTRRATGIFCLLASVLLVACSSSGSGGSSPTASAAYISGAPRPTATVGERYSFQPSTSSATDERFTIVNLPQWAQFSQESGLLSGTPTQAHVGKYAGITITVEAGGKSASLPAFSIEVVKGSSGVQQPGTGAGAGSITLNWVPPDENTDGSSLTNLAGYRIYSGNTEHDLQLRDRIDNPGISSYVIDAPEAGELYFAISSVSTKGIESQLSNVVHAGGD